MILTMAHPVAPTLMKFCRDNSVQNIQCDDSSDVRPEAFAAFNEFVAGNRGDNDAFFSAFSSAWVKATLRFFD